MSKQPLLSIIVPVYNSGRYLSRCVESLLRQTYTNTEIILVDDGSADDSPRLCDDYARDHAKVRVVHKENGGAGLARNSGLELAQGEYVAFVDADDYVEADMYDRLMAQTEQDQPDAVFCDFVIRKADGSLKSVDSDIPPGDYSGMELLLQMLGAPPEAKRDFTFDVSACKAVYSRKTLREHAVRFRSEREVVSEDLRFHLDFLPVARHVRYIPERLYYYCENEGSQSHSFVQGRLEREKYLYQSVCRQAEEILRGDEMLRWQRFFLGRIRTTIGQQVYYAQGCSFRERNREIRNISGDELVRQVIGSYPIHRNPVKLRIFNTFLKWKFCAGMYILLALNR